MITKAKAVTLEQTVRLLASSDTEILGAQANTDMYSSLAFALIEFIGLVSTPRAGFWDTLIKLWRIYSDAKNRAQKKAGSLLSKSLSKFGGNGICDKVEYCRNKAQLKELFDFADSPEGKIVFDKGVVAAMETQYAETIKKLQEILGEAAEAIAEASKEISEEIAEDAIPLSFIFMSIKYGFDDLCKCCSSCEGTGLLSTGQCEACGGYGHLRP